MKRKSRHPLATGALAMALAGSAQASTVALFDFGSSRGTATAQQFIDTGVSLASTTDSVTMIDNTTFAGAANNTPFALGASGLSLAVDNISGAFTYGNSPWTGNANMALMGDAWLFNGLGPAGVKNLTLSGLGSVLSANTAYRIYFLGSYTTTEFTSFGSITYNGTGYGTLDSVQISGSGASISNAGAMASSVTIATGASVADILTFTVGKAAGSTGGAAGIQGIAIVSLGAVPEPGEYAAMAVAVPALIAGVMRRRRRAS